MTMQYLANDTRAKARSELAEAIWSLPYTQLRKYGISSYRSIEGQDIIGIPIWIAHRPPSNTISVTAGKSLDSRMAAVGAIIEAIEFWASENPSPHAQLSSYGALAKFVSKPEGELLPLHTYPLARDNVLDEYTPLYWELVEKVGKEGLAWMPSNMIWLKDRIVQQFLDVQQSSNGLASGVSAEDAVLQGLYEVIERDGWTINYFVRDSLGIPPFKIPMNELPPDLEAIAAIIRSAGLHPFLFDCTQRDLGIPVIGCALFGRDGVGLFGGYGCHLNATVAAHRAMLESVQSRLCFISGARDDLYRRDFLVMKRASSEKLIKELDALEPIKPSWPKYAGDCGLINFADTAQELHFLRIALENAGIDRLYFKVLAREQFGQQSLVVVKVIAPQLEGVFCDYWQTNGRATTMLSKEMERLSDNVRRDAD
jgi:ribosomal protein S12 methylthiotransferase accessory factor